MVYGRRALSLPTIIVIAIGVVLVGVAAFMFLSAPEPPLKMQLAVQGSPTAGGELALQVTLDSASARDVTLVAELFNAQQQLVNIARESTKLSTGQSITVVRLKLPYPLPQGRYVGVVTARYDKTKILTQDISVRVVEPKQTVPAVPVVNNTRPSTPTTPVPVVPVPGINLSPHNVTPAAPVDITPTIPRQNATQHQLEPGSVPISDVPIELDDIAALAKTDRQKALDYCDKLVDPDHGLCISRIAVSLNDGLICARLSSSFDQDRCYMSLSASGDTAACALVQDESLRATCEAVAKFYTSPTGGVQ